MIIKKIEVKIRKSTLSSRVKSTLLSNLTRILDCRDSTGVEILEGGHFFRVFFDVEKIPFSRVQQLIRREPNKMSGQISLINISIVVKNPLLSRSDFHLLKDDFFKIPLNGINSQLKSVKNSSMEETITPIFKSSEIKMEVTFLGDSALLLSAKAKKSFLEDRNIFFRFFEMKEKDFCKSFLNNIIAYDSVQMFEQPETIVS